MTGFSALRTTETRAGEHETESAHNGPSWPMLVAGGVFLIILSQLTLAILGTVPTLEGEFFGFDTYNRMSRVQALWEHGRWFDSFDPGISPPAGFQSHWTRPLDGLIVALAVPLRLFLPDEQALFWAGSLISPLLQIATFVTMMVVLRPAFRLRVLQNLPLVFALCYPIMSFFFLGRPDHHGLELAATLVLLVLLARALFTEATTRLAVVVGLVASLAAWIEISGFLLAVASLAGLGVLWCFYGRRFLIFGLAANVSMLFGLVACTFLERGPELDVLLSFEGDRISLMHPTLAALPLVFWLGGLWLARRDRDRRFSDRIIWAAVAGAAVAAAALILLPSFQYSEILGVDKFYYNNRSTTISEYQPIYKAYEIEKVDSIGAAASIFRYVWVYLLGLISLLFVTARSSNHKRPVWIILLVIWAISVLYYANQFFGLQFRHMAYFSALVLLPLLEGIDRLLRHWGGDTKAEFFKRCGVRASIIVLPILANILFAASLMQSAAKEPGAGNQQTLTAGNEPGRTEACEVGPAATRLAKIRDQNGQAPVFLALPELSGKLRYHLRAEIFAIGQHRYQAGFKPMLEHFRSGDMEEVERWLREAGVDAVILCARRTQSGYFKQIEGDDYFYRRLQLDDPPAFLEPYDTGYAGLKAYVVREPDA